MIEWFNTNSGAVSAVAALITGLATAVIAWFSWGTWRMFKKEERRAESHRQRISYTAAEIDIKAWSAQQILRLEASRFDFPIEIDASFTSALDLMRGSVQRYLEEFPSLANRIADEALMTRLGNARLQALRIRQLIRLRGQRTHLSKDDYLTFVKELAQWSSCLEALMKPEFRQSARRRKRDHEIPAPTG